MCCHWHQSPQPSVVKEIASLLWSWFDLKELFI
jgi:hypothetical protein